MKNIYEMDLLEQLKTETHYILRVPGGWIFTDRRGENAVGTFVPFLVPNDDRLPFSAETYWKDDKYKI